MNRYFSFIFLACTLASSGYAQRDMTPSKRSQAFGTYKNLEFRTYGLQFSFGPTYMLTKAKNQEIDSSASAVRPFNYTIDPKGKLGFFVEAGMVHYPAGQRKLALTDKRIITYYDWGLGFKYFGGQEKTTVHYLANDGSIMSTLNGEGRFYNSFVFGRFTAHNNLKINGKYYIDNGFGLNFDYRVLNGSQKYDGISFPQTQYFHKPFVAQLHYDLGFGIRFLHGSILPSAQIPLLGFYDAPKANPSLRWFSSKYRPILFKVKIIWLLEKKKKNSCTQGSEEDRKRNQQFMQGQ